MVYQCPRCLGSKQEYVDWADDYAPCTFCDATGLISEAAHRKVLRVQAHARIKSLCRKQKSHHNYRIQCRRLHWNDFDTISCIEWNTIRSVYTKDYGLKLVETLNKDCEYNDYGNNYRLVDPNGRVVLWDGGVGGVSYSETQFAFPGEY